MSKPSAHIEQNINLRIGMQLRSRRTLLGLSQEALGNRIGVTSQQIQKYEKGANVMNAIRLHEFAQLLKVPVSYFYENTDEPPVEMAEDHIEFENEFKNVSERETLEVLKSFRRIKDHNLRKRIADMLRVMSQKDI